MGNNFVQMAASAGPAVAYTIGSIFKHFIDCVQLHFTNGFTNIGVYGVNCLWLIDVTLIFIIVIDWCDQLAWASKKQRRLEGYVAAFRNPLIGLLWPFK